MTVGVIGAGKWGINLVRTFHMLGNLVGVADTSAETRDSLSRQFPSLFLYSDYRELLEADVEAVAIATPACTHYKLALEALMQGKDVFVEKPLALSRVEAEKLVEVAQKCNRILMVGHLLIYQPAILWIKNFLSSGGLGKVSAYSQERLKLGRVRQVENVLWSLGIHDVAVLLYLVDQKPLYIDTVGQCILQEKIEDEVYVHLKFSDNVAAHLHVSWLWPKQERRLTIVGSKAMLVYDELQQKVTLYEKSVHPNLNILDAGCKVVWQGESEPLLFECRHFLECVKNRQKPLTDGKGALDVIDVLELAEKSLNLLLSKTI